MKYRYIHLHDFNFLANNAGCRINSLYAQRNTKIIRVIKLNACKRMSFSNTKKYVQC